jgi:membrane protein CcdC involved in cytochrome C biogenesis
MHQSTEIYQLLEISLLLYCMNVFRLCPRRIETIVNSTISSMKFIQHERSSNVLDEYIQRAYSFVFVDSDLILLRTVIVKDFSSEKHVEFRCDLVN